MIVNINELKLFGEIISCEGVIVALYKRRSEFVLFAKLNNSNASIYFQTPRNILLQYLKSEITLREVYLSSESIIVPEKDKKNLKYYLKEEFITSLNYGQNYLNQIPRDYINSNLIEILLSAI